MPKDAFGAVIQSWNLLAAAVEKEEGYPSHVVELSRELAALREETIRAKARHLDLVAETLKASRHFQESVAYGKVLESRLRNLLKGIHGSDSTHLIRYGIQPRREPRKRKEKGEENGKAPSS